MSSISLDFRGGHIGEPLEPDLDDFGRSNVITAKRRNAGEATAVLESGPRGTVAIGANRADVNVNPQSDDVLPMHASYHLALATEGGPRYPTITVDLNANPALAASVAALDVGDRLSLQSIPPELGRPSADTLVLGYTEVIGSHSRKFTFNSQRGGILSHVGVLDGGATACLQTSGAQLGTAITDTQTAFLVATTSGSLFTSTPPPGAKIIVRDREIVPVGAGPVATDTFTRTVSNGWGTADTGQVWANSGGTNADFAVDGSRGTITLPTGDTASRNVLLPDSYADFDARVTLRVSQLATGANINGQLRFRSVDGNNYYVASCAFDTSGTVDVSIIRVLAGSSTTLVSASNVVAYAADSDVHVHVEGRGPRLRAKMWIGSRSVPPAAWTLEATDASHAAGQLGVRAFLSGSNTNTNPVVSADVWRSAAASVTSAVLDTFTRSASSGWGTAQTGQVWVVGAGTASLFSATGTQGQIAISATNTEHHIAVPIGHARFQRVRTSLTLAVTPSGAGINWGVLLRRQDASNLYWIDVQVGTDSSLTLRVISKIAGANTQLATAVSRTVHSTSVARVLVADITDDDVIRAKVWAANAAEPGWELTYQASHSDLQSGQSVGCIGRLMTGNTNTTPVNFLFDDFEVLNPQQFSVTRDPDQAMAHPDGGDVLVYQPIRLTL